MKLLHRRAPSPIAACRTKPARRKSRVSCWAAGIAKWICCLRTPRDYVHRHIAFNYQNARSARGGAEAFRDLDPAVDYSTPFHALRRGLPHLQVEFRQDEIAEAPAQLRWARRFAQALASGIL